MEWAFISADGRFREECPRQMVKRLTQMFLNAGYVPFKIKDLSKLNYTNLGMDWRTDILWVLNTTDSIIRLQNPK